MLRYVAVSTVSREGESLLVIQRVHLFERAHNMVAPIEPRQFELLATPFVMERYPDGKIIGWFESWQELSNHNEIEVKIKDVGAVNAKG